MADHTTYTFQRFQSGIADDRGNAVRDAMELIRAFALGGGSQISVEIANVSEYADKIQEALKGDSQD